MRQKIFLVKRLDSKLSYVQGPMLKKFQQTILNAMTFWNMSKSNSNDSMHFTIFRNPMTQSYGYVKYVTSKPSQIRETNISEFFEGKFLPSVKHLSGFFPPKF